tara:strand:- start:103 stop:1419 length:1317 start_codon:yes stop_codon:yes gene_type:complete
MYNNFLKKNTSLFEFIVTGISTLLNSILSFVVGVIIARNLQPDMYGFFASTLATVTLFFSFSHLGIAQFWLKKAGKFGWRVRNLFHPSILIVLKSTSLSILILILIGTLVSHNNSERFVTILLSFHLIGLTTVELLVAKYQLEQKYDRLALFQLVPNLLRFLFILVIFYVFNHISIFTIALIYFIVSIISPIIFLKDFNDLSHGKIDFKNHYDKNESNLKLSKKQIINSSIPFALAGFFHFIYYQSDIILVKYLSSNSQAGYYSSAVLIFSSIMLIPTVIYQKYLMPKIHFWFNYDKSFFVNFFKKFSLYMFIIGTMFFLLVYFNAEKIILFVFGKNYFDSIHLIKLLSISLPISFLSANLGATLVTGKTIRKKARIMGFIAITNILLNLILIPFFDAQGAAYATLICNVLLFIIYFFESNKLMSIEKSNGKSQYNLK